MLPIILLVAPSRQIGHHDHRDDRTAVHATLLSTCPDHPSKACIRVTLNESTGEELNLTFTTFHAGETTQIGVIDELLMGCRTYRAPSGYDLIDSRTVDIHYVGGKNIDMDVLFEAKHRLDARIDKTIRQRNAEYRRDPKTHLVHKR